MSDTINNINTEGGPVIQGGTFFGATFVAKQYVNSMDNSIDNGQLTIDNEELEESKQLSIVNSQLSIEKGQLTINNEELEESKQLSIVNSQLSIDNGQLTINNEELEESKQLSIVNSQLSIEKEQQIPEELTTPEAREVLSKLHRAGLLDERWQPVGLSYADMGTLAGYVADKLCIQTPWKTFGCLWQKKPDALRSGMNRGTTQNKTDLLLDRIKKALR